MTKGEFRVSEFLIGIGIGLLTGLLWAPRSGEDTRKAMTKEWIGRQGESLESKATELQKAYQDRSPGA